MALYQLELLIYLRRYAGLARPDYRRTVQQSISLKMAEEKLGNGALLVAVTAMSLKQGVIAGLRSTVLRADNKYPMCKNYGHIVNSLQHNEHVLRCSDCGACMTTDMPRRGCTPIC